MSSSAQDEFNQLLHNNKEKLSSHPEDRDSSDRDSNSPSSDPEDPQDNPPSDSDDYDTMRSRTATYHVPNTVYDANTGPKGVIADAQAFERARRQSHRRTLGGIVSDDTTPLKKSPSPDSAGGDDEEARFMRKWRESRMHQLQNQSMRRSNPRRRMYGGVDTVDAAGYLDAIEKVASDTVVVVCVYDPDVSPVSPAICQVSTDFVPVER